MTTSPRWSICLLGLAMGMASTGSVAAEPATRAAAQPHPIWQGSYFGNSTLAGAPILQRDDAGIDFDWGGGSPAPGVVAADHFSVRWTGRLDLAPGSYRFFTTTDDGVRLWVAGHLLIDRWYDQSATTRSGLITLSGPADLQMEYYENEGNAVAKLRWELAAGPTPPAQATVHVVVRGDTLFAIARRYQVTVAAIMTANGLSSDRIYVGQRLRIPVGAPPLPTTPSPVGATIVDELSAGFRRGGSATGWHSAAVGYGDHSFWTLNNDARRSSYNWARWYPELAPGRYEVFAFVPRLNANTGHAKYWVAHADGFTSRVVDQSRISDAWVSLGTYRFDGAGDAYVSLSDVTGERRLGYRIGFDAVRWTRR